jgi:Ca2+-binding RTX toxin-like protein
MPNSDPVAHANAWLISDTESFLPADQLLRNDSDPDGDALTVDAVLNPVNGSVSLVAGIIDFTPTAGATDASFDYTVDDGAGGTATAAVTIQIVDTGAGDDTVTVPAPPFFLSYVDGQEGADTLTGASGQDTLIGGEGDDSLDGRGGDDFLDGQAGDDTLLGNNGHDTLLGGAGNDNLEGGLRGDVLDGGTGDDTLLGSSGQGDVLIGGTGNDLILAPEHASVDGGAGNDTISGGRHSDLDGGAGVDVIHGGGGFTIIHVDDPNDVITGSAKEVHSTAESYTLSAGIHTLILDDGALNGTGGDIANSIFGNDEDNQLSGEGRKDLLEGADGADTLSGGVSRDTLSGGDGNDVLIGGTGIDSLSGGADRDVFRFNEGDSGVGNQREVIDDFSHAEHDKIHLKQIDADTTTAGDQHFSFIGNAGFTGVAGQLRWEDVGADRLVQGDTDGNGIAELEILLQGSAGSPLTAGDFVL